MPAKSASTPASSGEDRIAAARAKNLEIALQQIHKDFGDGSIMRLGDNRKMDIEVIPSGNLLIDRALGAGGFPRGRIMEVFGRHGGITPDEKGLLVLKGYLSKIATELAVITFQKVKNLEPDGIVGQSTWSQLPAPIAQPAQPPQPVPAGELVG